jgi:hypothetical protein
LAAAALTATSGAGAIGTGDTSRRADIDPARFGRPIDNAWYPLEKGTRFVFRGLSGGRPMRDVVTVTRRTRTILGVRTVVVTDNVYVAGRLSERTSDWFTEDAQGNVWYFGEASAELDSSGRVKTTEGSWEAGVDGARPGIVMPAHPRVGESFRQEYYAGHAEDHFAIESLSASVTTPYVSSRRAMRTREWSPLDPGVNERKFYVRGVGLVEDVADASVLVSVETR